ncbi:MAG TPA: substrate-binding domain-containing protein [Thermoleophilia bacterium]|nr:substrate-binding domain-containing protein [Thermoleophilia bacterium]
MPGTESYVYLEIAETVRRLIVAGEFPIGERLPSVRDMAERWKCTPNTVSRAYTFLQREGLVTAHRGGGTRVASQRPGFGSAPSPEWQWATLVNRAENYLLEALALGNTPAHAEAALAAAISRWQELRRRPAPGRAPNDGKVGLEAVRFSGSHDLTVELLIRMLAERPAPVEVTADFIGSLGGLMAVARGEADLCGTHLWDEATGEYNVPFVQRVLPNRSVVLLTLVERLQGLIVAMGNPLGLTGLSDLARGDVRTINRQPGSGTRVWLDAQLKNAGVDAGSIGGYGDEEVTHIAVARAVAEQRADVGLGISAAATAYGLDFIPLAQERYDLVIPAELWDTSRLRVLREVVGSDSFKEAVGALGGYDVSETGAERRLN